MGASGARRSWRSCGASSSAGSRWLERPRQSTVGALRESVERVRQRELDRFGRLHPEIPGETIDAITRSLVNQLFHLPSQRLKKTDDESLGERVVALFSDDAQTQTEGTARQA